MPDDSTNTQSTASACTYEGQRSRQGWDDFWKDVRLPTRLNRRVPVIRAFMRFFRESLPDLNGRRVMEIGCCPGRWMVHFAHEHGAQVSGLDYTEEACAITRRNLALHHIKGECALADFRDPDLRLGPFDLVFSMGVVEHYPDLAQVIHDHARMAAPGGHVLLTIPNFAGWHGRILRRMNRSIYDEHVLYTLADLRRAGESVGLTCVRAQPLGGLDWRLASGSTSLPANALAAAVIAGTFWLPLDSEALSAHLGVTFRKDAGT